MADKKKPKEEKIRSLLSEAQQELRRKYERD